jgi:hypothetical protein
MYKYQCQTCRSAFENSISQSRCPTFKCQSRHIKDVTPSYKGPTYSNLEWTMEDEGEKTRRKRDRQGRSIRQQVYKSLQEEFEYAYSTRTG